MSVVGHITEKAFQQQIIDLARLCGWHHIYHTWDSRHSAAGFFDLILVRERIVAIEIKREGGRLSKAQEDWGRAWINAGGEWYWFKPSEWERIVEILQRGNR